MRAHHAARRGPGATGAAPARTAAAPPPPGRRGTGRARGRRRRRRSAARGRARRRGRAAGWRPCHNDDAGVTFAARHRSRRGLRARPPAASADDAPRRAASPPRRPATELAVPFVVRTRPSVARTAVQGRSATVYLAGRPVGGAGGHRRRAGKGGCSDCRGRHRPGAAGASSTSACGRGRQVAPALVLCCAAAHEPARGPGRRRSRAARRRRRGRAPAQVRRLVAAQGQARAGRDLGGGRAARGARGDRAALPPARRGARRPLHRQPRAAQARPVLADGRRGGRRSPPTTRSTSCAG